MVRVRFPSTSESANPIAESCPCGSDCSLWQSQGEIYYICQMSTNHLQNALLYLQRARRVCSGYWPSGDMAQLCAQQAEDEMDNLEESMSIELCKRQEGETHEMTKIKIEVEVPDKVIVVDHVPRHKHKHKKHVPCLVFVVGPPTARLKEEQK